MKILDENGKIIGQLKPGVELFTIIQEFPYETDENNYTTHEIDINKLESSVTSRLKYLTDNRAFEEAAELSKDYNTLMMYRDRMKYARFEW